MTEHESRSWQDLLDYLKRMRRFDFEAYKPTSLARRIERRMKQIPIATFADYIHYLDGHSGEFGLLFNSILVNVTDFFRDETAWAVLQNEVVPKIIERKQNGDPIRIWSAGCAAGQEAYTLAMLFAEALGAEAFQERVKIYATDADEDELTRARHANYSAKEMSAVPTLLRDKYFEAAAEHYTFRNDLRRSVIFGQHDLVQDAPISRLDLLVCRNTLMYFNSEAQTRILRRLHFALNEGGFLFLGKAEMMMTRSNLFAPVNIKARIFSKVSRGNPRERILGMAQSVESENTNLFARQIRIREAAIDAAPVAQLVVDVNAILLLVNQGARTMFGLSLKDIGRPLQDLEISYRPVELRSLIEQAYTDRRTVSLSNIQRVMPVGETQYLDLLVVPLHALGAAPLGVIISFTDVSQGHHLQEELRRVSHDLETTNQDLQSVNQELETTNEELQSANEELETTNEELQSTNEELETMNEELQSSNQELQTVNEELRRRTNEFNQIDGWLQSVLSIPPAALVVVDRNLNVLMWNHRAEDMWGLRADEVKGKSLFTLDIALPLVELGAPIRATLDRNQKDTVLVVDTVNRRGKPFRCQVTISRFGGNAQQEIGVALLMEDVTERQQVADALKQNEAEVRALLENLPTIVLAQDDKGAAIYWSEEAERVTGWSAAEIVHNPDYLKWLYPDEAYRSKVLREQEQLGDNYQNWQANVTCKNGTQRTIVWSSRARQLPVPGWKQWTIGVTLDDKSSIPETASQF